MAYGTLNSTVISVTAFGARGDGSVTNSIAERNAIQSAIESLQSKGIPGTIYFPRGTYMFSGTLDVTGNNLTFTSFDGAILRATPDESAKKFNVSGAKNISFQNLAINAGRNVGAANTNQNGFISTINSQNIEVHKCNLTNSRDSLIYLGGGTRFARVIDNYFSGHFCGVYSYVNSGEQYSEGFLISNNSFGYSWIPDGTDIPESACIKIQTNSEYTGISKGHTISDNVIDSTTEMGIELWKNGYNSTISNNTVSNTWWGISLDNQKDCCVIGNTVKAAKYLGIECAFLCSRITISSNNVNGFAGQSGYNRVTTAGLFSANVACDHLTYVGNIVQGCSNGVQIQNSVNTILIGNTIRDNNLNIFCQGNSLSQITANLFEAENTAVSYHIFFDASSTDISGFHLSDNKFRGGTTNQSIFYYTNGSPYHIYDLCVENNVTDSTTSGAYNTFIGGQTTPVNYVYRNNFGPTGGSSYNTIIDATDNPAPYAASLIGQGISYYGGNTFAIPSGGITGDNGVNSGIWLCVWSGGGGYASNVRVRAQYFNNLGNNSSTDMEIFACLYPYNIGPHSILVMPQASYGTSLISTVRTQSNISGPNANNSIWIKVESIGTGHFGSQLSFSASANNVLNSVYSTYTEPTWDSQSAVAYPVQNQQTLHTNGISIGNAFSLTPNGSGQISINGILGGDGIVQKYNYYDGMLYNSGIVLSLLTGTLYNPASTAEMDSAFYTGVYLSGGIYPNLNGISFPYENYLIETKGYFYASGDGQYSFGLNSDDAADIFIDGKLMAYWYGGHGSGTGPGGTQNTTYLNQGFHRFYSRLHQGNGASILQCLVKSPVDTGYYPIPRESFYYGEKDSLLSTKSGSLIYVGSSNFILRNLQLNGPTATSANAGGISVPATAAGFTTINITGRNFKIPYYN